MARPLLPKLGTSKQLLVGRSVLTLLCGSFLAFPGELWSANPPTPVTANTLSPPSKRATKAPLLLANSMEQEEMRRHPQTYLPDIPPGHRRYLVSLVRDADQDACLLRHNIACERSFRLSCNGFAACLTDDQVDRLRDDVAVVAIEENRPFHTTTQSQTIPHGLKSMAIPQFPPAKINGLDERIDVDVVVMEDNLVQPDHPDLNVYKSHRIYSQGDVEWHATAVAGIIGALDNDIGVVGVAPGVRIWSLSYSRQTYGIDYTAAAEWLVEHADEIEIVNCSWGRRPYGAEWIPGGQFHEGIQTLVSKGVVVVCAAGNDGKDIAGPDGTMAMSLHSTTDNIFPAGIPESMAVSAMDPVFGGLANFSNYSTVNHSNRRVFSPGAAIDVAAPGSHIATTTIQSGYTNTFGGTSAATPHVSGLVALYIAQHGRAHDAAGVYRIRQAIVDTALPQSQWPIPNTFDRDTNHEGLAQAQLNWSQTNPDITRLEKRGGALEMEISTVAGYRHSLEASTDLTKTRPWDVLTNIEGTGAISSFSEPLWPGSRFFRLSTRPMIWGMSGPDGAAANIGTVGSTADGRSWGAVRGQPGPLAGDLHNKAFSFNITTDTAGGRLEIPFQTGINPPAPFSFEVWVKPNQTSLPDGVYTYGPLISCYTPNNEGWVIYQANKDFTSGHGFYLLCAHQSGNGSVPGYTQAVVNRTLDVNQWYHVIGVVDASRVRLYVNGAEAADTQSVPADARFTPNPSRSIWLGGLKNSWAYSGSYDEFAIYPHALTPAQIQAHYQAGRNPSPSLPYHQVILSDNPSGYWRFNEP